MAKKKSTLSQRELHKLERVLEEEYKEVTEIEHQIRYLEEKLIEKRPSHFSKRNIINAFFASLIFGITIVLKGRVIDIALALNAVHLLAIIIVTSIILFGEIYYIGYTRVKPEENRKLGQFMAKRFFAFYGVAFIVSFGLIYMLGINSFIPALSGILKLAVLVSMPCAIAAAIPSMLKQY